MDHFTKNSHRNRRLRSKGQTYQPPIHAFVELGLAEKYQHLPFRPGVGMMIINQEKKIFVAKRIDSKSDYWQMPQGGIDIGETPSSAALREMQEEIGSNNATIIAESNNWYSYRIPLFLIPKLWHGQYCGQKQKWFLMEFHGQDQDINLDTHEPEFDDWQWMEFEQLLEHVIPFKLKLYKQVLAEFQQWFL